jgi:hypothetical protein
VVFRVSREFKDLWAIEISKMSAEKEDERLDARSLSAQGQSDMYYSFINNLIHHIFKGKTYQNPRTNVMDLQSTNKVAAVGGYGAVTEVPAQSNANIGHKACSYPVRPCGSFLRLMSPVKPCKNPLF